jgi:hypothetical protein
MGTAMSEDVSNLIFLGIPLPIGIISMVRPKWIFFILTYGHPKLVGATGRKFFRICAAWLLFGTFVGISDQPGVS